MDQLLTYKGYVGSVQVSLDNLCLHGKLQDITDLVTYEGVTVSELVSEFETSVDEYIELLDTFIVLNRRQN
jgi:predicted HicB family RNase H-like nuclease